MSEFRAWIDAILASSPQDRAALKKAVTEATVCPLGKELPGVSRLMKKLNTKSLYTYMGFVPDLPFIKASGKPSDLKKAWHFNWEYPSLVYHHRHLPATVVVGPSLYKDNSKQAPIHKPTYWQKNMLKYDSKGRHSVKARILEGIEYYNAKWKKQGYEEDGKPHYELVKKDPTAVGLVDELKDSDQYRFKAIAPKIVYVKNKGNKQQLSAIWDHDWAHPSVIYQHRQLPYIIIAGPNNMLDDSIINKIPENSYDEPVGGFTG